MTQSHIQTRVWLSIGIFVLGFLITTIVSGWERIRAERALAAIADALLPAEESGGDAEDAFQRAVKAYSDAFVMDDRSALDRAGSEGAQALESLNRVGVMAEVNSERSASARRLAASVSEFLAEAHAVYGSPLPVQERMTPEFQERIRRLSENTALLWVNLKSLASGLRSDLQQRMDELRRRSATMRVFIPCIFAATMGLAITLVNLTVKRSILAPLARIQNELAQERDLLRILMDHIPDTIYFKDAESKFIRVNRAQATMLGIDNPQEAIGRSDADYFDAAVARKTRADEQRILQTGESLTASIEHLTRNGLTWWVTASKVRVRDEARNTNLIVGISRNVTDWKVTMDALEESEEEFRRAEKRS